MKCSGQGIAAMVGLPYLSSIYQNKAYAQSLNNGKAVRFLCMYHPNGVMQRNIANDIDGFSYFPKRNSDTNYNLLQSNVASIQTKGLRDHATLIEGLHTSGGSGNAHMQGISCFLTGTPIPNHGNKNMKSYKHRVSFDTYFGDLFSDGGAGENSLYLAGNSHLDPYNDNFNYYNPLKNALSWDKNGWPIALVTRLKQAWKC